MVLSKKMRQLQLDLSPPNVNKFLAKRMYSLRKAGKCFKCFQRGHVSKACTSTQRCMGCSRIGHFLASWPALRSSSRKLLTMPCTEPLHPLIQPPSLKLNKTFLSIPATKYFTPFQNPPPLLLQTLNLCAQPPQPWLSRTTTSHPKTSVHGPRYTPSKNAHLPPTDEFFLHRSKSELIFLLDCESVFQSHAASLPRSCAITFVGPQPPQIVNLSHDITSRIAQHNGGAVHDCHVESLNDDLTTCILVCPSRR